jgi:anaerobic magnesium-protoporphyrin IX monomethyl ester cyclase
MKITLINPPQIFSQYQIATGITPPLGIAYLASFCISKGHDVQLIDAPGEEPGTVTQFQDEIFLRGKSFEDIIDSIDKNVGLIGISNLFSFAYPSIQAFSKKIRETFPDIPIVMGGPHPTHMFAEVLMEGTADYVIRSEGELALVELCRYLEGEILLEEVSSLSYFGADGVISSTSVARRIRELDQDNIPFPARHLLPMENYIAVQEAHGPTTNRWTSIISSRGCPYGCTFCDIRRSKWVGRSASDVVDEIEHCIEKWGISEFHFEDDNMTIRRDRMIDICDQIISRGLKISWQTPNGIRASVTDQEMLEKMKESGCIHITLAPESGSSRVVRDLIQKGNDFSHDQLLDVGKRAHKLGMKVAAYFVLGMPGEKPEDIEETIAYGKKLAKAGVDEAGFALLIPLPGTPVWDHVISQGDKPDYFDLLIVGDLNKASSYSEYLTADQLNNYRRRAYYSFFLTRALYHPGSFIKTMFNVLRGVAETKTENYIRTFVKRQRQATHEQASASAEASYVPYSSERTVSVLLQTQGNYGYSNSWLKALNIVLRHFVKTFFGKQTVSQDKKKY